MKRNSKTSINEFAFGSMSSFWIADQVHCINHIFLSKNLKDEQFEHVLFLERYTLLINYALLALFSLFQISPA